jgi:hypothetical protein
MFGLEQFPDEWPTQKFFLSAHKWTQSAQKIYLLVCESSFTPMFSLQLTTPIADRSHRYDIYMLPAFLISKCYIYQLENLLSTYFTIHESRTSKPEQHYGTIVSPVWSWLTGINFLAKKIYKQQ